MKKVFVSQPMRDKTDDEIMAARSAAVAWLESCLGEKVEVLDTFFKGFNGNRLQFLGKSISEGLALADVALFVGAWERYDGCRSEHFVAAQYGTPIYYSL